MGVNLKNMWETALFSGKIYTADKNFTRPPVATNSKSDHLIWYERADLKDRMVTRPVSVSEKWENTGARLRLSNLWGRKESTVFLNIHMKYMEQFANKTLMFHLEFSGRAPIKVLDPPVGGSYGHSTQDEDWRLQFKMWQHFQTQRYEILRWRTPMIPGCSSQRERRGRWVSQGEDAGDCHLQ